MSSARQGFRLLCWNVAGWPTHGYGPIDEQRHVPGDRPVSGLLELLTLRDFQRIEECAKYIHGGGFALVGLQEAWVPWDAGTLGEGWAYHWWQTTGWLPMPWPSGALTLAASEAQDDFSVTYKTSSWHKEDWIARKAAAFTLWPFGWLCNTHLDAGRHEEDKCTRTKQVEQLIPELQKRTPFVLLGYLNLRPDEDDDDKKLLERLQHETGAEPVAGEELDFVLASPELEATRAECPVVPGGLSDHDPLCALIPLP